MPPVDTEQLRDPFSKMLIWTQSADPIQAVVFLEVIAQNLMIHEPVTTAPITYFHQVSLLIFLL